MSEVASMHSAALLQTPQQVKNAENEDQTARSIRKPRNREVTSRYKSSSPAVTPALAPNRRFPTPNGDRVLNVADVPSPKRAQSAERRRPSPSRTTETRASSGSCDAPPNGSLDVPVPPKCLTARTELLWPSTRGLSTSMQCESHPPLPSVLPKKSQSFSRGKDKSHAADHTLRPSANTGHRKPTVEHKSTPARSQSTDQAENAQPLENVNKPDNRHWPSSNAKIHGAALSRSVDLSAERGRPLSKAASLLVQGKPSYGSSRAPRPISSSRAVSQSINEGQTFSNDLQKGKSESRGRRGDSPVKTSKSSSKDSLQTSGLPQVNSCVDQVEHLAKEGEPAVELACSDTSSFADNVSDTDSVSSGGTTITTAASSRGTAVSVTGARAVRGTNVPARFWLDAANRSIRSSQTNKLRSSILEPDLAVASVRRPSVRHNTPMSPEILTGSNLLASSSPWGIPPNRSVSVILPPQQPLSLRTSPYISTPSPARSRAPPPPPSSMSQSHRPSSAAVMLTFGADTSSRRGKKGLTQIEESHLHRILHNRLLQWRFVIARAEAAMDAQIFAAEKSLYNVYARIFDLQASTTTKRIQLQEVRQAYKLKALLSVQAPMLEAWSGVQQEHCLALNGSIQALESAVLQVPVTGGVKADTLAVKEAIGSAFDVMNSVENSVNYLLPGAQKTNLSVSELARVVAQERVLLEECADLLAVASALEMEECSLRTHLVQLEHERARVLGHLMDATTSIPDSILLSSH